MGKVVPVGIRIEPDLKKRIDQVAEIERRSVAALFEIAMIEWLDRYEAKRGKGKPK